MDISLLNRLRTLVVFEVDTFEKQLGRLRSLHYPSGAASSLIDNLVNELRGHRQEINQVLADFPDDPERAGRALRSQHRLLVQKLRYLSSLEDAETVRAPWSLVPSIEWLASALLPDKPLLATCTQSLNYGIRWNPAPKSAVQRFAILELPAIHKTNAFLHVLVGHELFHPILQEFLKSRAADVISRLRTALNPIASQVTKDRFDELVEQVRYIWQRALEELMCDMGCAAIFGPAAVFASAMLHIGGNLDEPPSLEGSFYPPPRYRLREVLRYAFQAPVDEGQQSPDAEPDQSDDKPLPRLARLLSDRGFGWARDVLEKQFKIIQGEVQKQTDLEQVNQYPWLKLAYEEVQGSLPQAWDYVRDKAQSTSTSWLETIEDIPKLLESIGLLVPPGEIRETVGEDSSQLRTRSPSLSAISIAMWLYRLREEEQDAVKAEDNELRRYHRLCRLMLKAFEDVEIRREYDSRKKAAPAS